MNTEPQNAELHVSSTAILIHISGGGGGFRTFSKSECRRRRRRTCKIFNKSYFASALVTNHHAAVVKEVFLNLAMRLHFVVFYVLYPSNP